MFKIILYCSKVSISSYFLNIVKDSKKSFKAVQIINVVHKDKD